jgi:hypothetical protein
MSLIFDPSLITVNICSSPFIVLRRGGSFFFPVYVKALTVLPVVLGVGRKVYPVSSTLFNDKKNAMQQMPSTTCSDVQSINFVTLELERTERRVSLS